MDKTIVELFAGVGGFRLGFERQSSANRSTHVVQDETFVELRVLTPVECERISQLL